MFRPIVLLITAADRSVRLTISSTVARHLLHLAPVVEEPQFDQIFPMIQECAVYRKFIQAGAQVVDEVSFRTRLYHFNNGNCAFRKSRKHNEESSITALKLSPKELLTNIQC